MDGTALKEQVSFNKFCPCIDDPSDACYCTKLDTQYDDKMIYFCSNKFELCDIFKHRFNSC